MQVACAKSVLIGGSVLLSFRVANHRSLREEQELLLLPAYDKTVPATPIAAIYGANASGKSNLLDALHSMRAAVLDSFSHWDPLGGVPRDPFALAPSGRDAETRFGVDLSLDGSKYVYGFAVTDERVTEEWLYHYPRGRRRVLFEREMDDFRFGDSLRGPKNLIEEVTRPNSLFLSAAAHHQLDQLIPIYSWFGRQLSFIYPSDRALRRNRTIDLLQRPETAQRIVKLLKAADLGIADVRVRPREPRAENDHGHDIILSILDNADPGKTLELGQFLYETKLSSGRSVAPQESSNRISDLFAGLKRRGQPEIVMVRDTAQGQVALGLEHESSGTRTWFDFLGMIVDALDNGFVLAVDELDATLHPLLAREFVRLFQSPETNPRGAQLIFTTHDAALLARHRGEEILRRDEVWFTEKNQAGESQLYPLTDFKPRAGLNWERRYLGGSMGAVPFLDEEEFVAAVSEGEATQ